jgi:leucyl/phenylalanyl-tRNA--protein transferase
MPVFQLSNERIIFPSPEFADPDGLLAFGGDLSAERLLLAYRMGIFPWFSQDDPILWWSPDPRFVLFPKELKVAKSMRSYFNQKKFEVTFDQDFEQVIRACQSSTREGQNGTWITPGIIEAYCQLHELGFAHSLEVWQDREIVGGLYGIALGKCFFGESMFTKVSNASKFGFITLVQKLERLGFWLVDCQQQTGHLQSLGARAIPRQAFLVILEKNEREETLQGNWSQLCAELK